MTGKNRALVAGLPLLAWGMRVAKSLSVVEDCYLSSDDPDLLEIGQSENYHPIFRPRDLATDSALGCDVLAHAVGEIQKSRSLSEKDIVVMQHANSASYTPSELKECIDALVGDPSLDCMAPAHLVQDYHPYRVKRLGNDYFVGSFLDIDAATSSNRQELPAAVAFNHSFWAVRVAAILANAGDPPWKCMGNSVRVAITPERKDVHTPEDILRTTEWVSENLMPLGLHKRPPQ